MSRLFTFRRADRLKSKKIIDEVFTQGKSFRKNLVRFVFIVKAGENRHLQTGFLVSKRNICLAVKRNRIKRQMREIYRLHKPQLHSLLNENNKSLYLFIVFEGREKPQFSMLQTTIHQHLVTLKSFIQADEKTA